MCVGSSTATIRRIYLLDFGLARQFKVNRIQTLAQKLCTGSQGDITSSSGQRENKAPWPCWLSGHTSLRVTKRTWKERSGTEVRFLQPNLKACWLQCTCDDLISNFYTMVELSEGCLPWSRLRDPEDIARRKRNTSFEELFPLVKFVMSLSIIIVFLTTKNGSGWTNLEAISIGEVIGSAVCPRNCRSTTRTATTTWKTQTNLITNTSRTLLR